MTVSARNAFFVDAVVETQGADDTPENGQRRTRQTRISGEPSVEEEGEASAVADDSPFETDSDSGESLDSDKARQKNMIKSANPLSVTSFDPEEENMIRSLEQRLAASESMAETLDADRSAARGELLAAENKITPLFVFDGKPPPEKRELIKERSELKRTAEAKYNEIKADIDNNNMKMK